jgi:energy-converting hydrogenase Eha subunit H
MYAQSSTQKHTYTHNKLMQFFDVRFAAFLFFFNMIIIIIIVIIIIAIIIDFFSRVEGKVERASRLNMKKKHNMREKRERERRRNHG